MRDRPKIVKVEVRRFTYETKDFAPSPRGGFGFYQAGSVMKRETSVLRVFTDAGVTGEYMGAYGPEFATFPAIMRRVLGRNALERDAIWTDVRHALQQTFPKAGSPIDIALWDLAGKFYDSPVYELLGGAYRTSLPVYASTMPGDTIPGSLSSPEDFADFAERCLELGYRGFKTHPWPAAPIEKWVALNNALGKRVGGKMDLMVDAACAFKTFGDALKLGLSCDDNRFFWWEDPYMHAESAFPYRKLHQMVKTPLLQMEHVWGLEAHVDFIVADGTDFVRGDVTCDGGITGVIKIAHACEGFGLDVEIHRAGPAERQVMAAIRNTNYYEMALVHPKGIWMGPGEQVYDCDYRDGLQAVDKNGCVPVPTGPGLGIALNWDYINKHTTGVETYE